MNDEVTGGVKTCRRNMQASRHTTYCVSRMTGIRTSCPALLPTVSRCQETGTAVNRVPNLDSECDQPFWAVKTDLCGKRYRLSAQNGMS